jgi:hypothetical protein
MPDFPPQAFAIVSANRAAWKTHQNTHTLQPDSHLAATSDAAHSLQKPNAPQPSATSTQRPLRRPIETIPSNPAPRRTCGPSRVIGHRRLVRYPARTHSTYPCGCTRLPRPPHPASQFQCPWARAPLPWCATGTARETESRRNCNSTRLSSSSARPVL